MKYKVIVFDMDGTSFDSKGYHDKMYTFFAPRIMELVGKQEGPIEQAVSYSGGTEASYFVEMGLADDKIEAALDILDDTYANYTEEFGHLAIMQEGLDKALKRIKENGQISILLSNSLQSAVAGICKVHGLDKLFDIICGAPVDDLDKVDRIKRIIKDNGYDPKSIVCIGDSKFDFEMAKELGADSCFMDTPIAWAKDKDMIYNVIKPTFIAHGFDEIPDLFEK